MKINKVMFALLSSAVLLSACGSETKDQQPEASSAQAEVSTTENKKALLLIKGKGLFGYEITNSYEICMFGYFHYSLF